MLFELRQYRTRPGQRDNWVQFMDDEVIPFQIAQGMTIIGTWTAEEEDDLFVWIRRFDSEEDRVRLYIEVYESDRWKTQLAPRVAELIFREKIKVTRLAPTPRSPMR